MARKAAWCSGILNRRAQKGSARSRVSRNLPPDLMAWTCSCSHGGRAGRVQAWSQKCAAGERAGGRAASGPACALWLLPYAACSGCSNACGLPECSEGGRPHRHAIGLPLDHRQKSQEGSGGRLQARCGGVNGQCTLGISVLHTSHRPFQAPQMMTPCPMGPSAGALTKRRTATKRARRGPSAALSPPSSPPGSAPAPRAPPPPSWSPAASPAPPRSPPPAQRPPAHLEGARGRRGRAGARDPVHMICPAVLGVVSRAQQAQRGQRMPAPIPGCGLVAAKLAAKRRCVPLLRRRPPPHGKDYGSCKPAPNPACLQLLEADAVPDGEGGAAERGEGVHRLSSLLTSRLLRDLRGGGARRTGAGVAAAARRVCPHLLHHKGLAIAQPLFLGVHTARRRPGAPPQPPPHPPTHPHHPHPHRQRACSACRRTWTSDSLASSSTASTTPATESPWLCRWHRYSRSTSASRGPRPFQAAPPVSCRREQACWLGVRGPTRRRRDADTRPPGEHTQNSAEHAPAAHTGKDSTIARMCLPAACRTCLAP